MSINVIELLVQGGAVGIALVALGIVLKVVTNHNAHTNDVIGRNTEALLKVTETLEKHNGVLDRLLDRLKK